MRNPRVLTEGALMLAIFTVLMLLSLYVPLIGTLAFFVLPLPLILFSSKYSLWNSMVVLIGSLGLSFLFGGLLALPVAFMVATTGVVIGWCVKAKVDKMRLFMAASLTLVLNIVIGFVVSILFLGVNIIEDSLKESKAAYYSLFESLGQEPDKKLVDSLESSIDLVQTLMPTLFVGISVVLALLFIVINFPIMKRLGRDVPVFKPFREWKLPKSILWYYLITLVLSMILQPEKGTYAYTALINVLYVLQSLMAVQGLSFIYFFAHVKGWSKGILVLITIISIPLLYLVRILGIIDLGFDLRQRLQRKS
ncbi:YybS family protein [Rossellomorea sp. YZS02]|uniref:YybS family protein n=1 Tax=Rossellomorea sp. YZS02 TaxID=3097358 RepID=UPI002A0CB0F3|nr:YybS family protein [Rossellomorea sp. YZS02]MDX8346060.1 YybS family protein [Rossellomorea sp. YZS02]